MFGEALRSATEDRLRGTRAREKASEQRDRRPVPDPLLCRAEVGAGLDRLTAVLENITV